MNNMRKAGVAGRLDVQWPPERSKKIDNFAGTGIAIYDEMFGALSQDATSPYSRISVANSSFSLDPTVGCPARCAYCVVGSSARDLNNPAQLSELVPTRVRKLFSGRDLLEALAAHPGFIADRSVISIGTGSSEAFLPQAEDETWAIMKGLVDKRLRNPVWIVTKLGLPNSSLHIWLRRFEWLLYHDISVILSITYAAAPTWMEPHEADRFRHCNELRSVGVKVSHHYRPVLRGVNDSANSIALAVESSLAKVDAVCVGGLRPDPGIRLVWEKIYGLDPSLLPSGHDKDLPETFLDSVTQEVRRRGSLVPVVDRSSKAICFLLGVSDYNLYEYRPNDNHVFLRVPTSVLARVAGRHGCTFANLIESVAASIGLTNIVASVVENDVRLNRVLSYQEHRLLIHAVGHSVELT
jgi:DNA repair photolyase